MRARFSVIAVFAAFLVAAPAVARGAPESFADLSQQLLPTVVNISTSQTLKPSQRNVELPQVAPGSPLEELFKNFSGPKSNLPRHVTSLGSGFVIDPSGYIVTNNHVIEDADQITVMLNDGSSLPAKLVGRDDKTDLALLKINPRRPIPSAHFGDSDRARIGDWVIAIGNPFGLGSTVTAGIVSARNRNIDAGPYDEFIQTDAPINRGNSGGPLFDMGGNVVGINSAIFSPTGGSVGIGFAIPSNLARDVINQLRQFGQVRRGWVGVNIQPVTADLAEGLGLPGPVGALIGNVTPNGPAARAGIRTGDVITAFDGKKIPDARTLSRTAAGTPIGKTVTVDIMRNRRPMSVRLTVQRLADPPAKPQRQGPPAKPRKTSQLGLSLSPLNGSTRATFRLPGSIQGVVVTDVMPDSPAEEKNLRAGDVIVAVQDQMVRTPEDVQRRIDADLRSGRKVEVLLVNRAGALTYVALRF
ncbi:serine protease Do [Rhizomicrobium palustre]|uniref:Probable periplasmic serine endoprotease DegP-like n=1 Tax=Rhizomicrobium palustre TaxID=189966 RepID=A0A846MV97_9PROT|nr:DegQ family serine endoprotease [Rhizomicrobium palustre]NIK87458.1 serine protease Do [Rhizomicrobium palustre]